MLKFFKFNVKKWCDTEYQSAIDLLQDSEIKGIEKYRYVEDAKRSISSHLIIKSVLSQMHEKTVEDIQFRKTMEGRPTWRGFDSKTHPALNFNVSHSGDWSIGCISSHCAVGADVQNTNIQQDPKSFVQNIKINFTAKEISTIFLGKDEKEVGVHDDSASKEMFEKVVRERFFCYWVLKESFLKLIGMGFSFDAKRVEIRFDDELVNSNSPLIGEEPHLFVDGKEERQVKFKTFRIDENHIAAIALSPIDYSYLTRSFKRTLEVDFTVNKLSMDIGKKKVMKMLDNVEIHEVSNPIKVKIENINVSNNDKKYSFTYWMNKFLEICTTRKY